MTARSHRHARLRRLAPLARTRPLALLALAAACAAVVALVDGPLRLLAGAVLCLYLPGRLAVLVLFGPRVDPALGVTLTFALSLAATMLVGFGAAVAHRIEATTVASGLLGLCALLAAVAARRREEDEPPPSDADIPLARRPDRWLAVAAAVPLLALSALLAVRVADAVRHRWTDASFTELSLEGSGRPAAVVRSLERGPVTFRYEERRDGRVVQTAQFTLRPGERTTIGLVSTLPGRVELVLYRADRAGPYHRVIP